MAVVWNLALRSKSNVWNVNGKYWTSIWPRCTFIYTSPSTFMRLAILAIFLYQFHLFCQGKCFAVRRFLCMDVMEWNEKYKKLVNNGCYQVYHNCDHTTTRWVNVYILKVLFCTSLWTFIIFVDNPNFSNLIQIDQKKIPTDVVYITVKWKYTAHIYM